MFLGPSYSFLFLSTGYCCG